MSPHQSYQRSAVGILQISFLSFGVRWMEAGSLEKPTNICEKIMKNPPGSEKNIPPSDIGEWSSKMPAGRGLWDSSRQVTKPDF